MFKSDSHFLELDLCAAARGQWCST